MESKVKKGIRILLVDDHQVVREGLRHMLEREEDMEVVGGAANAREALTQVVLLSPEVVLTDIKMPGMDGIELARQLKEKHLSCNVIMLTLYDEYLAQAMEVGATGYLLKDIKREELTQAIRQIYHGQVVISNSITSKSRPEYLERADEKAEGSLPQEQNGSSANLEEVQLVLHPPVDANQVIRFVSQAEEMFESRMRRMVGSWQGSTAITLPLPKPIPLEDILDKLGEMSEVEATGEEPLIGEADPSLLKKASATSGPGIEPSKIIFVTLKTASPHQLSYR